MEEMYCCRYLRTSVHITLHVVMIGQSRDNCMIAQDKEVLAWFRGFWDQRTQRKQGVN